MIHISALRHIGWTVAALSCFCAACGGSKNNPQPQPTATNPSISSVSVNPSSVTGGQGSQGTVTLNTAPTVGTTVALSSNNGAATVPSTVTVNSGATTNTFNITTTAVGANTAVTITGTLNGSATATLTLVPAAAPTPPPPAPVTFTARLRVVSFRNAQRKLPTDSAPVDIPGLPAGTENVCPIIVPSPGTQQLACELDGSASTSPNGIRFYRFKWRLGNIDGDSGGGNDDPKYRPQIQNCTFFGGINTGGNQFINMPVTLTITNNSNQETSVTVGNVSVFPAGQCGYLF